MLQFGLTAQNYVEKFFSIKGELITGGILKHSKHLENIVKEPTQGAELSVEFPSLMIDKDWPKYYKFPKIGISAAYIDLGNPQMLGKLLAIYPYLNFPVHEVKNIKISLKAGAGTSYLTKTFDDAYVTDPETGKILLDYSNAAIGSHFNVYFALGANIELKINNKLSFIGELNSNHASNGSIYQPNSGLNIFHASAGFIYSPNLFFMNDDLFCCTKDMPRKMSFETILSGGVKELYFRDNVKYTIGSFRISAHKQVSNTLRLGLGLDYFYDEAFSAVNASYIDEEIETQYRRTLIRADEFQNRFRAGLSIQPEFVIDKLIFGFHLGLYLFNPIKNLEPYQDANLKDLNKPLIYPYNINKEDGWFYSRASLKYYLNNHYFLSIGLKTHLQKAEFIEWGLGYKF